MNSWRNGVVGLSALTLGLVGAAEAEIGRQPRLYAMKVSASPPLTLRDLPVSMSWLRFLLVFI
jgi:hypothetical protein